MDCSIGPGQNLSRWSVKSCGNTVSSRSSHCARPFSTRRTPSQLPHFAHTSLSLLSFWCQRNDHALESHNHRPPFKLNTKIHPAELFQKKATSNSSEHQHKSSDPKEIWVTPRDYRYVQNIRRRHSPGHRKESNAYSEPGAVKDPGAQGNYGRAKKPNHQIVQGQAYECRSYRGRQHKSY